MELIEKYREREKIDKLVKLISKEVREDRRYNIMEICGTHTMSISRFGIRSLLPKNINLISGPGCPVCVTSQGEIDAVFNLLESKDVVLATYGDLMKVPGSKGCNLIDYRAKGHKVEIVYSPMDLLKLTDKYNDVVFVSIGFETTVPAIAAFIQHIDKFNLSSFSILPYNKTMPRVIDLIISDNSINVDGFLCPGHVSVITGLNIYQPIVDSEKSAVVTGFEPIDILYSIYDIVVQVNSCNLTLKNNYERIVKQDGNKKAVSMVEEVFEPSDSIWRGIGNINGSGLTLRKKYDRYNALTKYDVHFSNINEIEGCLCGDVLKGKIMPYHCGKFKTECTPENPFGPCMVSSEGACAAYYKYGDLVDV